MDGPPPARGPSPVSDPSSPMQPAAPLRPGEWRPREEFEPPPKHEEEPDNKKRRKDTKSLAEKRGEDWALRKASNRAVAVTRPIRIDCYADRMVLAQGTGDRKIIAINPANPEKSIDKFMAAVWEHMDSWGMAGKGMYWKPILNVYVTPGAESQFEDMETLLQGSGLTIERKQ
jgi:hypothetical protein